MSEPAGTFVLETTSGPDLYIVGAILLSAFIGASLALVSIAKHRIIAKKKAAHDFVLMMWKDDIARCQRTFTRIWREEQWEILFDPTGPSEYESQLEVNRYLNHLELLSISIKMNVLDETIVKAVYGDQFVITYERAVPFICRLRKDKDDNEYFIFFEELAKSWKSNPTVRQGNWFISIGRELFKT